MRRFLVLLMLTFASVVGVAATTAPVPTSQDCVMWARRSAVIGEELACWEGPCDLPGSTCKWTQGLVNGVTMSWCVCSGGENVGECGGQGVLMNGETWLVYCGQQPCLGYLGFCHPNTLPPNPGWMRACSCGYLPPPWF